MAIDRISDVGEIGLWWFAVKKKPPRLAPGAAF
jgi:hypothetical protein